MFDKDGRLQKGLSEDRSKDGAKEPCMLVHRRGQKFNKDNVDPRGGHEPNHYNGIDIEDVVDSQKPANDADV